jgi:hypothetical protein
MEGAAPGGLKSLMGLRRTERLEVYYEIMQRNQERAMSPKEIQQIMEKEGVTCKFVGQDLASARSASAPFEAVERGIYKWKTPKAEDSTSLKRTRLPSINEIDQIERKSRKEARQRKMAKAKARKEYREMIKRKENDDAVDSAENELEEKAPPRKEWK